MLIRLLTREVAKSTIQKKQYSIFDLPKERSNLISGTPKFLPVTENFLVY